MMKVWKSNLQNHLKLGFFWATVESVLLYGAECWMMTGKMRNRLDGTYAFLESSGGSIKPTKNCTAAFLRLQIHCWRRKDEVISDLLLWGPKHGARRRGRPATTYVNQLQNDTGLSISELKSIMGNEKEWMKLVNGV